MGGIWCIILCKSNLKEVGLMLVGYTGRFGEGLCCSLGGPVALNAALMR